MSTYQFARDSRGSLLAIRQAPVNPHTKGTFVNETSDTYAATAFVGDWTLPAAAIPAYTFFEYFNGATEKYYRINIADMTIGGNTPEPLPIDVRHEAWPGTSQREMEITVDEERQEAIAAALAQAKANKVKAAQDAERKGKEAIIRTNVEAQYEAVHGSQQDAIAKALKDAGLSEYA